MDNDLTSTIRLVRRPRVETDVVGGTVWVDPVDSVELELISTSMLEVMIDEDEPTTRKRLLEIAESGNGLLARDRARNTFEVVPGDELKRALDAPAPQARKRQSTDPASYQVSQTADDLEELTLVSTQMVRVMLEHPELSPDEASEELQLLVDAAESGGFDPYNNC